MKNQFDMTNVLKTFGEINRALYGINPYQNIDEEKEKLEMERSQDLEDISKD